MHENLQLSEAHLHPNLSERHQRVLASLSQPLTAKQIARGTGLPFDSCRDAVAALARRGMVRCLNPNANKSRLYWLTRQGSACQRVLRAVRGLPRSGSDFPRVDWPLYGWVCFTHRAAVVKSLVQPLQPSAIKRKARSQNDGLRMSANNVRDIIRLFHARGIVAVVRVGRKSHPRYRLTETGEKLRVLLTRAEVPGPRTF